ncbi:MULTISPECIES: LysR family transcriptional regulator [Chromobacterium]|uniref:LysR family transcriptional regulator n=2 Tax=Chromobacterium TaxID=535 RepID=A0ABX0LCZ1_9NEIS|nr:MULTISPECIES: LysR family transcriptional regulator [Chromobacterium]KMN83931.1 LysR family transcriptional regulator [Chromobacterium sp. LK11]MCP1291582.1 LysR family transcriptional regulator [Chromobacterium sp. S0633]MCS3806477.1 DNA-binding transcriptional LysR family regulator [Chromobacterium alkanivorans]MCS3820828.1 DNA-binding transcriptional LysR family regulator [Chromobacterium alkanivorans]MCS3875750.1 DNA-binding transcriptional LysR family regulator [Chromobacterium alkaniv
MDALRRMAVFAMVVDKGSMNGAARELGMTPSAVSQHISKLEQQHGVSLLHRTTRKLTLTEAGSLFYQGCADMLAAAQLAEQRLLELRDAPVGELRIAAPTGFAGALLSEALTPLLSAHSGLKLRLFFHDEMIDLVDNRIDLALRAGVLKDSSLVARHLADWPNVLCASPAYLARQPAITRPEQLSALQWVALSDRKLGWLAFEHADGSRFTAEPDARLVSNNIVAARQFVLAGMGVAVQPEPEIRQELADGRLLRVLPEWSLPPLAIYAVTPRRDIQPAKVRYAIEALRASLSK